MTAAERQRRHRRKLAGLARAESGDELHETPARATESLLQAESLPLRLWEPACGYGAIVSVLKAAGRIVVASDLRSYGEQDFVQDFLTVIEAPAGIEGVVTNPPFSKAADFVRHGLKLAPIVVILQRLSWLESTSMRSDVLEGGTLKRVLIFRKRLERMHRFGWTGKKASPKEGHAWFVFDRAYCGPPTLHWI
jgi:hypothetical protein